MTRQGGPLLPGESKVIICCTAVQAPGHRQEAG